MALSNKLIDATVIGGHVHTDTTVAVTAANVAAGANPTKTEYDALVGKFNTLLTQLKDNGVIKA